MDIPAIWFSVIGFSLSTAVKSPRLPLIIFPQAEHLQAIISLPLPLSIPFPQVEHFNKDFPIFSGLFFSAYNFFNLDRFTLNALPHSVHFHAILSLSEITQPHLLHFFITHYLLSLLIQITNSINYTIPDDKIQ